MKSAPADWQLPAGVDRGLWHYVNDEAIARNYDATLTDCPLLEVDRRFVAKHFATQGRVLDLGCGTGRLLVPLAQQGFWAVGVDLSPVMLEVAREKARVAGVTIPLVQANLVDLGCLADANFDYAACLFSTLGMIQGADARQRVLAHVHRLLKPGGKFILHVHNRWFTFWNPQGRRWLLRDQVRSWFQGAESGNKEMPPHQGLAELTMHLFTRREAVNALRSVGFHVEAVMPLSLRQDGRLLLPWWFGRLRAYGYLLVGVKKSDVSQ